MGAYVILGADEDLESALRRFHHCCRQDQKRAWTKRRYGYYEKPSALRRKRKRLRLLNARTAERRRSFGRGSRPDRWVSWGAPLDLATQHQRTGPTLAVGR